MKKYILLILVVLTLTGCKNDKKDYGTPGKSDAVKESIENDNINIVLDMEIIDFDGEKYTSFINGYSIALTKETCGEMKLFEEPDKYLKVEKIIVFDEIGRAHV